MILLILFTNCTVYAENNENKSYSTDAILKEIDGPNNEYDYDLVWDDMTFSYIENRSFVYNDKTREYDLKIDEYWSDSSNKVNITNNSYEKIDVLLQYTSEKIFNNIKGQFSPNYFRLYYNENKESELKLYGKIENKNTDYITIGTITIKIQ